MKTYVGVNPRLGALQIMVPEIIEVLTDRFSITIKDEAVARGIAYAVIEVIDKRFGEIPIIDDASGLIFHSK
jgi:hypothetical protein